MRRTSSHDRDALNSIIPHRIIRTRLLEFPVISRPIMPPKRKAPADPLPSEPSRRKLRSDGPPTPAKPPQKSRTTARTTRHPAASGKPRPEVLEPPGPMKKKPVARMTRPKVTPASSQTGGTTEAPKRRGRPPSVRTTVIERVTIQANPQSKKPPSAKPPITKPPPRTFAKLPTLPTVISDEPTRPPRSRLLQPASPGKRRRNERSPSLKSPRLPSPSKKVVRSGALATLGTTNKLPAHYHGCLQAQKQAIMTALRNPPEVDVEGNQGESPSANELAYSDLGDLLTGSIVRGEGNSCLLIGPRGSGKTRVC